MIKRVAVLLIFILSQSCLLLAQRGVHSPKNKTNLTNDSTATMYDRDAPAVPVIKKPARDFFMIQFGYNNWIKPDSIKTKPVGFVFNAFICYDFPIKKSKMSFATGIGINTASVYFNNQKLANTDTGVYGNQAHFIADTSNYKRYKLNITYLQAPFELRYYSNTNNRNKGFKAAIGMQVGLFLGAHTKDVTSVGGVNIKYKEDTKRYFAPWNFAATARIGLGNFSLFGSYNITGVFKQANGPAVTPFSAGICLTGL